MDAVGVYDEPVHALLPFLQPSVQEQEGSEENRVAFINGYPYACLYRKLYGMYGVRNPCSILVFNFIPKLVSFKYYVMLNRRATRNFRGQGSRPQKGTTEILYKGEIAWNHILQI